MTAETTAPPQSRGALGLMFDPVFGALFWGKMFAVVAVWTHGIVAAIVMYDATRSALMVGLVGVVQFGPQLLLSPTSGKWADTGDPARQILLGRVLCVAGSGLAAVWLFVDPSLQGMAAAIPVLIGTLLVGFGFVVGGPAMQSIVPNLIRDGELSTAMALNSMPMTVGRIVGPASGAYLAAHLGSASGFAVSAALHLVFAIFLVLVRFPSPPQRRTGTDYRVRTAIRVRLWGPPAVAGADRGGDGRYRVGSVDHADAVDGRRTRRRHPTGRDPVSGLRRRRGGRDGHAGIDAGPDGLGAGVGDRHGRSGRGVCRPRDRNYARRGHSRIRNSGSGLRLGHDGAQHGGAGASAGRVAGPDHGVVARSGSSVRGRSPRHCSEAPRIWSACRRRSRWPRR